MTERQQTIYEFILFYVEQYGYPPTITDICKGCYTTSREYIRQTLWTFERQGLIELTDGKHRAMKIIKK